MSWFIDGYNVTRSDPATRNLALEEQRARLEARLRTAAPRVLGSSDYLIVWDGAGGFARGAARDGSEHFTRMATADDSIVNHVTAADGRVGVVTSDNELANRVKAMAPHGVELRSSSVLYESSSAKAPRKAPMRRDVGIPAGANEINRELKELWGIE